jgi:hypothetical protein
LFKRKGITKGYKLFLGMLRLAGMNRPQGHAVETYSSLLDLFIMKYSIRGCQEMKRQRL